MRLSTTIFAFLVLWASPAFAINYVTLDVPGSTSTLAGGIYGNKVVGSFGDAQYVYHGFRYDGTTWTTFDEPHAGTLGGQGTFPTAVSDNVIVGYFYGASPLLASHGFRYDGNTFTELDYPGSTTTIVSGVYGNKMVGTYTDSSYTRHGFLYDGTTWKTLNAPAANHGTYLYGINSNTILGAYDLSSDITHAFRYDITHNTYADLNGGAATGIEGSRVVGFNDGSLFGYGQSGFAYDLNNPNAVTTIQVPGSADTSVSGISNGTLVGTYRLGDGVNHGFTAVLVPGDFNNDSKVDAADYVVWRKSNGPAADYALWRAHYGQSITGSGSSIESASVPEPSTFLLLGIGAISLLGYRRAKYQSSK